MGTKVYTFKVVYGNCDNKIYRVFEVSSNYTLAKLGYVVLASFRTYACHLFFIEHKGVRYETDIEHDWDSPLMRDFKLSSLSLQCGERLKMVYDFGCEQEFDIVLTDIRDMQKNSGRSYPRVIDGAGKGIIEDMPAYELLKIIKKTTLDNRSDFEMMTESGDVVAWDFRDYEIDEDNNLLKSAVRDIQLSYEAYDELLSDM